MSNKKPNGIILYRGPSMLDGAPIVCIATGIAVRSDNSKTGAMIQTWIIRDDIKPTDAAKSGDDASVCGDCVHRGVIVDGVNKGRSCYVTLYQAPRAVFEGLQRGIYGNAPATIGEQIEAIGGKALRLGSYGDPAAVPLTVWDAIAPHASTVTGYTHQWKQKAIDIRLAQWCMASCDSAQDTVYAGMLGYRSFRVRRSTDETVSGEVICPASEEAGRKTSCSDCKACGGLSAKAKANIVIMAHGVGSGHVERRT